MAQAPRRVVTGLDGQGRSTVIIDGPSPKVVWRADGRPLNRGDATDTGGGALDFALSAGATTLFFTDFAPAGEGPAIGMHATDTLDYAVVLSGRIVLVTETGEREVGVGELVVDRGVTHAWRNDRSEACRMLFVFIHGQVG